MSEYMFDGDQPQGEDYAEGAGSDAEMLDSQEFQPRGSQEYEEEDHAEVEDSDDMLDYQGSQSELPAQVRELAWNTVFAQFSQHQDIAGDMRALFETPAQIMNAFQHFSPPPSPPGSQIGGDSFAQTQSQSFGSWDQRPSSQQTPWATSAADAISETREVGAPRFTATGTQIFGGDEKVEYIYDEGEAMSYAAQVTDELVPEIVDEIYAELFVDGSSMVLPPPEEQRADLRKLVLQCVLEQMKV